MSSPEPTSSRRAARDPVAEFRRRTGAKPDEGPPLGRREIRAIAVVFAQVVVATWAFGGVRLGVQWTLLALGLAGLAVVLWPVREAARVPGVADDASSWPVVRRLLLHPFLWLGVAFGIYLWVGHRNPAWRYETDGVMWWMMPVPHGPGPAGVDAPMSLMNAPRMALILAGPWLGVMTAAVGLRRRRSWRRLQLLVGLNLVVYAGFALAQWMTGTRKILGFLESENGAFWGTFVYGNQAAALLNLGLVLVLGYALHRQEWTFTRLRRGGSAAVPVALSLVIGASVLCSLVRGGILVGALLFVGFFLAAGVHVVRAWRHGDVPWGATVLLAALGLVVGAFYLTIDRGRITRELTSIERVFRDPERDLRVHLNRANLAMFLDRPVWGWGAGGYRHLFPLYQRSHPLLVDLGWGARDVHFRFAHNDWLQYPIEFGVVGALVLLAFPLSWVVGWLARPSGWRLDHAYLLFGAALTFVHAGVDFLLYCPSILLVLGLVLALPARLAAAEIERFGRSGNRKATPRQAEG